MRRHRRTHPTGRRRRKGAEPWSRKAARAAETFLDYFESHTGRRPDLSLDRIRDLDRFLEMHFGAERPLSEEMIEAAGYYFAEIWRHSFGGRYLWDKRREALAIRKGGISVYPLEKVRRVLEKQKPGGLEAYAFVYARKTTPD